MIKYTKTHTVQSFMFILYMTDCHMYATCIIIISYYEIWTNEFVNYIPPGVWDVRFFVFYLVSHRCGYRTQRSLLLCNSPLERKTWMIQFQVSVEYQPYIFHELFRKCCDGSQNGWCCVIEVFLLYFRIWSSFLIIVFFRCSHSSSAHRNYEPSIPKPVSLIVLLTRILLQAGSIILKVAHFYKGC